MNNNKNILITGASQGIGYSIAKILVEKGHNVFITGRNVERLKKISKSLSIKGFLSIDLSEKNSDTALIKKAQEHLGNIDVIINNAGDYVYSQIEKTSNEDIERIIKINLETPFRLIKLVVPEMKKQKWGRVINIGSISGAVGEANASLYSMTKAGLMGLSKALALELAQDNITANTINPGWVDTNLVNNTELEEDLSKDEIIEMIPQRRFVHPEEVANLCAYLISEEAKGITGQSINLCAGLSLG